MSKPTIEPMDARQREVLAIVFGGAANAVEIFMRAKCAAESKRIDGQYHVAFGSGKRRSLHVADTFADAVTGAWAKYLEAAK